MNNGLFLFCALFLSIVDTNEQDAVKLFCKIIYLNIKNGWYRLSMKSCSSQDRPVENAQTPYFKRKDFISHPAAFQLQQVTAIYD